MKKIIFIISLVLNLAFISCGVGYAGISFVTSGNKVLRSECHPEDIEYDQFGPYCVWVIEQGPVFDKRYGVLISTKTPSGDFDSYGHWFYLPSQTFVAKDQSIDAIEIVWDEEGVVITDKLERQIYIPKAVFTGSR